MNDIVQQSLRSKSNVRPSQSLGHPDRRGGGVLGESLVLLGEPSLRCTSGDFSLSLVILTFASHSRSRLCFLQNSVRLSKGKEEERFSPL